MAKRTNPDPGSGHSARARLREGATPADIRLLRRSVFGATAPDAVERLARQGAVEPHRRAQVLHYQGDGADKLYLVLAGRVRVSRVGSDGREVVMAHRTAGSIVGEWGVLGHPAQRETAEVAEDARLLVVPTGAAMPLFTQDPKLARALLELTATRRLDAEARLEALQLRTVRSRLAEFVVDGAKRDGHAEPRGTVIRSRYTHLEIAQTVGATRETVTLTLAEMKRKGILLIERRRLVVRDVARLQSLI